MIPKTTGIIDRDWSKDSSGEGGREPEESSIWEAEWVWVDFSDWFMWVWVDF